MAFLASKTLDFGDGDTLHADGGKRLANFVKLKGLDDGGNKLHDTLLVVEK